MKQMLYLMLSLSGSLFPMDAALNRLQSDSTHALQGPLFRLLAGTKSPLLTINLQSAQDTAKVRTDLQKLGAQISTTSQFYGLLTVTRPHDETKVWLSSAAQQKNDIARYSQALFDLEGEYHNLNR